MRFQAALAIGSNPDPDLVGTLAERCAVESILQRAKADCDPAAHAQTGPTEQLLRNPDAAFLLDIKEAKRLFVLGKERSALPEALRPNSTGTPGRFLAA